jgi:hypothetical protein
MADEHGGPPTPPPPPIVTPPEPDRPMAPSIPAVPPVGTGAPGGRRTLGIPSPVAIVIGLIAVVAAFFGVQQLLDEDRVAPTAAEVSAAFVAIEGYEYLDMPAEAMEPLRQAFAAEPIAEQTIEHFDARQLTQAGTPSAVVFILAVDPDAMAGPFEDGYIDGFTSTSQATVEDLALGDTTGHIAQTPLGTIAFFFDTDGYAFNVVGRDPASVTAIARALEEGNS